MISTVSGGGDDTPPEVPQFQVQVAHSLVDALRSLKPKAPRLIVVGGMGSLFIEHGKLLSTRWWE